MEKVQIVRYALMQIAAVIYSVLASGAAVKVARHGRDLSAVDVTAMPGWYNWAVFLSDYGFVFLVIVVIWTVIVSYLSSPFARFEIGEGTLTWSGIIVAFLIAIAGTIMALGSVAVTLDTGGSTSLH